MTRIYGSNIAAEKEELMQTLTVEEDRLQRRIALRARCRQAPCPDKFRAIAEWWRISAEDSANPDEALATAASQDALANDMESDPDRYALLMPGESHWQRFQKSLQGDRCLAKGAISG